MGFLDLFKKNRGEMSTNDAFFPNSNSNYLSGLFQSMQQTFSRKSNSNVTVTPENAYQVSAYWLAVRAISEDVAKLPINLITLDKKTGKRKAITTSPLLKVLRQGFNRELDSMTGRQLWVQWMLTYGNAYNEVVKNELGELEFYPINPTRVTVYRDADTKRLKYRVNYGSEIDAKTGLNKTTVLDESEMLHLRGMGNEVVGVSVGAVAAQSLGISIAAQNFTGSFFGNNLSIGSVIETDKPLNAEAKAEIRKSWKSQFGGSYNAGELAILDRGFSYNSIQMSSTDAELLKTRKFQIEEIARWFRIPPHKLMDMSKSTFNNVEQQDINYATDTLTPWIARIEEQLKFKFHRHDNTFIDIDEKALSRGDMGARSAFLKEMFAMGAMSRNEVRLAEGLPEVEDGDTYYIPLNLVPVNLGIESAKIDNDIKKQSMVPDIVPMIEVSEGEQQQQAEVIKQARFESIKAKIDTYGIGVRAGVFTPQPDDEARFRAESGFPDMSHAALDSWIGDDGVRRPITITPPKKEEPQQIEQPEEDTAKPEPEQSTKPVQSIIAAYMPTMSNSISRLIRKESLSHQAADKKEPQQQLEHLNKFYIKFEIELADCFQLHADYLCNILGKEKLYNSTVLEMSKIVCNWDKSENQSELVQDYILDEVAQLDDLPKLGEMRTDDEGVAHMFTMSGWCEVDVKTK